MKKLLKVLVGLGLLLGLNAGACDKKQEPENTMDQLEEKTDDAMDSMKDAVEDAGDKVEDATDN